LNSEVRDGEGKRVTNERNPGGKGDRGKGGGKMAHPVKLHLLSDDDARGGKVKKRFQETVGRKRKKKKQQRGGGKE